MIRRSLRGAASAVHTARLRPHRPGSRRFGFLHIAKTAGTSTLSLIRELEGAGYPTPTVLGHPWTFTDVRRRYPWMQIAIVLRDPLERTISGFNDRRIAPPRGVNLWTADEAAAFALFPTVDDFLAACASSDRRDRAAARFAMSAISHLRRGYVHHFGGVDAAQRASDRIYCIGEIAEMDAFYRCLLAPLGIADAPIRRHATVANRSEVATQTWHRRLSSSDMAALRAFLADEYGVYEALDSIRRSRTSVSPG